MSAKASADPAPAPQPRSAARAVIGRLLAEPLGVLGLVLVLAVVLGAVFADHLTPYDPIKMVVRDRFQPPSLVHLLGTDHLGRDLLSRVLHGGRIALGLSVSATLASLLLGAVLGLVAGYGPRWLDHAMVLLFDAIRSFPTVMIALALAILVGRSLWTVFFVVIAVFAPGYGRIVRTQTIALRNAEFVLATRAVGAGLVRVLAVHILPNIIGPVLIVACMDIPVVITIEAGMSFLGLGVPPPAPSWGTILNEGQNYIQESAWPSIAGGLALILATLGFTFLGETLRDVIDPRLRREG
ncbi:MAG: ABC transporter permease [Dongiaceae bacterium]